jgi:hypothetical protein
VEFSHELFPSFEGYVTTNGSRRTWFQDSELAAALGITYGLGLGQWSRKSYEFKASTHYYGQLPPV